LIISMVCISGNEYNSFILRYEAQPPDPEGDESSFTIKSTHPETIKSPVEDFKNFFNL